MAKKKGILERLKEGPVLGDGGYLLELEKRGWVRAGPFTPEVALVYPDALRELHIEFREAGADGLATIQEHILAGNDLAVNGAGDDVARRQLGIVVESGHEALAAFIDQDRAFTAQRLGGQRRGIPSHRDGGGMELHEFRIGDQGAGARRHP